MEKAEDKFLAPAYHGKTLGIHLHLPPVSSFLVKQTASLRNGLRLALAATAHQIEQAFDLGVIMNDLTLTTDVDEVIRVQSVMMANADARVAVTQCKDHPWTQAKLRFG